MKLYTPRMGVKLRTKICTTPSPVRTNNVGKETFGSHENVVYKNDVSPSQYKSMAGLMREDE
jgi:hypothetical protein